MFYLMFYHDVFELCDNKQRSKKSSKVSSVITIIICIILRKFQKMLRNPRNSRILYGFLEFFKILQDFLEFPRIFKKAIMMSQNRNFLHPMPLFASLTSKFRNKNAEIQKKGRNAKNKAEMLIQFRNSQKKSKNKKKNADLSEFFRFYIPCAFFCILNLTNCESQFMPK